MIKLYIDGGTRGSRICLVDKNTNETFVKKRGGKLTNNELEYLALEYALQYIANKYSDDYITIYSDSQLVVNQISGKWRITTEHLLPLWEKCNKKMTEKIKLVWVSRKQNLAGLVLEKP